MNKSEVLVVLDIGGAQNKKEFEAYLKDEGFEAVEGETFAYRGFSSTPIFNVRAYIFEVFTKAFEIASIDNCKLICQIGLNDFETYLYEKDKFFTELN
jgi:hypothetical protein